MPATDGLASATDQRATSTEGAYHNCHRPTSFDHLVGAVSSIGGGAKKISPTVSESTD